MHRCRTFRRRDIFSALAVMRCRRKILCPPCLVPRPLSVFQLGQSVSGHVVCSHRIRHRNELTVRAWEKAVQGLGKFRPKMKTKQKMSSPLSKLCCRLIISFQCLMHSTASFLGLSSFLTASASIWFLNCSSGIDLMYSYTKGKQNISQVCGLH